MGTVTETRVSAPAGRASRGPRATAAPRATSTSLFASVSEASPVGTGAGAGAQPAWLRVALYASSVWLQPCGDPA